MNEIRQKCISWAVIVLALGCLLYCIPQTYCSRDNAKSINEYSIYAKSAVLMDAETGRVLYGKNCDERLAMASTTKIMTCIVTLETLKELQTLKQEFPSNSCTVSSYAASMPKVKLSVKKGETYNIEDLLYSLMLESHNDSAVVIAENLGTRLLILEKEDFEPDCSKHSVSESHRAVDKFIQLMNDKAASLDCENTHFVTPNGLDDEADGRPHETTARDLAGIMSYCILQSPCKDRFLQITETKSHCFTANNRSFSCYNHNAFLSMMEGAISGKTGFTGKAGYCYVGALQRDGKTFVVALLACGWPNNRAWKWKDTRQLMQYGLEHYEYRPLSNNESILESLGKTRLPVEGGIVSYTKKQSEPVMVELAVRSIGADKDIYPDRMLMSSQEELLVRVAIADKLYAPVRENTMVGMVSYELDGEVYRREGIFTTQNIEKESMLKSLLLIMHFFALQK